MLPVGEWDQTDPQGVLNVHQLLEREQPAPVRREDLEKGKDCTFERQFNENPSVILGCPGLGSYTHAYCCLNVYHDMCRLLVDSLLVLEYSNEVQGHLSIQEPMSPHGVGP